MVKKVIFLKVSQERYSGPAVVSLKMQPFVREVAAYQTDKEIGGIAPISQKDPGRKPVGCCNRHTHFQACEEMLSCLGIFMM